MRKIIFFILLCSIMLYSQTGIIKSYTYTSAIADTNLTALTSVNVDRYKDLFVVVGVDDTSETGFASDSINIMILYQIGDYTFNSSSKKDTAWFNEVYKLDTISVAQISPLSANILQQSKYNFNSIPSDVTYTNYGIDSTNVSGYATLTANIIPIVTPKFLKIWAKALAGHKKGNAIINVEVHGTVK